MNKAAEPNNPERHPAGLVPKPQGKTWPAPPAIEQLASARITPLPPKLVHGSTPNADGFSLPAHLRRQIDSSAHCIENERYLINKVREWRAAIVKTEGDAA